MAKVLVIGGANMDIKAKTLAPHVPKTSNPAVISTKPGGVGRNIAHNLARLGVEATLLTAIGKDANGEAILGATQRAGVITSQIIRASQPTGTYLALLDESGELVTAASDMDILSLLTRTYIEQNKSIVKENNYTVVDCNLPIETLEEIAKQAEGRLIVEPVSVAKSRLLLSVLEKFEVFLATPNLDQLTALTKTEDPRVAASVLHRLGLQNLVVHAGASGAYVSDGENFTHVPAQTETVVDVTGAGDAATAGLVAGLLQGLPLVKAAEFGQKVAAKVIASESSTLE